MSEKIVNYSMDKTDDRPLNFLYLYNDRGLCIDLVRVFSNDVKVQIYNGNEIEINDGIYVTIWKNLGNGFRTVRTNI